MNKIDFALVISVEYCNPNADPLNGKRPREDYDGYGEITDVCLKRKIRNRLQDFGENILIVQNDRVADNCYSIRDRVNSYPIFKELEKKSDVDGFFSSACKQWFDVRAFGQVFAFSGKKHSGVSLGVRGPVTIRIARSLKTIDIVTFGITKSTNSETPKSGNVHDRDSTTFSSKHYVRKGAYVTYGSIFPQLAEKTGFSEEDSLVLQKALATIFENDASQMRPSGSMVSELYWWEHISSEGRFRNSRYVFDSLNISSLDVWPYYICEPVDVPGVELTIM